jgi:peptide/nickel transport system permease protein
MRRAATALLGVVALAAAFAPWLAPNAPDRRFTELMYAPPTRVHLFHEGRPSPHIHPWRLVDRLLHEFEPAREDPVRLQWFSRQRLVSAEAERGAPLLLLGADGFGRDVFSRLLYGARTTLALALLATLAATLLGVAIGGVAGYAGGRIDALLSRATEFVLLLPAIYVALALRAVVPLVLAPAVVFALLAGIFTLLGWPIVARGVRAIVLTERERDYAEAARASGAGSARVLVRHVLPAARGHALVQATLLLPTFILAEATLSYVGLGFPDTTPTWGTMLQETANVALIGVAPWRLARPQPSSSSSSR